MPAPDLPVYILAHGRQERLLELPFPKHFLPVAGEPIIVRTLRLLEAHSVKPAAIVAPDLPEWNALCEVWGIRQESLEEGYPEIAWTVERLLKRLELGALFLLGDVAFSRAALRTVLEIHAPLAFFGKPGPNLVTGKPYDETYAFRCDLDGRKSILDVFSYLVPTPQWKLRDLRLHFSLPHVEIPDWTDDVDTEYDLVHVLPALDRAARLESCA